MNKRVVVSCDACGVSVSKTPKRVGARNYCSRACASKQHGGKIAGSAHPNWRGGAIAGRGQSWRAVRQDVILSQGGKCAGCGMTNDDHRASYRAGLHVHHRSPYRLSMNNSPDNLVALCIPCHGREEAAIHRGMSLEDFAAMEAATLRDRALGLHRDDFSRMYDDCPSCGGRKAKKSNLCRSCRNREQRRMSTARICPDCGGPKSGPVARRCWSCRVS